MRYFPIKIFLFINIFISFATSAHSLHFALFSPRDTQDDFWQPVEEFSQQTAQQLNIKLSIWHTKGSKVEMFKMIVKAKQKNIDAIIFPNVDRLALQMIKEAEQQQQPFLLLNADLYQPHLICDQPCWVKRALPAL
jgi:ABC-type sugar transport system substrate-binding protein